MQFTGNTLVVTNMKWEQIKIFIAQNLKIEHCYLPSNGNERITAKCTILYHLNDICACDRK